MAKLKKVLAIFLAMCMAFSMLPSIASVALISDIFPEADLNDGEANSFIVTTDLYRNDGENWVKTTKAAPGESLKARIKITSDFPISSGDLIFAFDGRILDEDGLSATENTVVSLNSNHPGYSVYNGKTVYTCYLNPDTSSWDDLTGTNKYDMATGEELEPYISDELYEEYRFIQLVIKPQPAATPITFDSNEWFAEFPVKVLDGVTLGDTTSGSLDGEISDAFVFVTDAICGMSYDNETYGYDLYVLSFMGLENGDTYGTSFTDPFKISSDDAELSTVNTVVLDGNGGTVTGGTTDTDGKVRSAAATIGTAVDMTGVSASKSGSTLVGWSKDSAAKKGDAGVVSAPVADYGEADTWYAVYEQNAPDTISYTISAFMQNADGSWPETATQIAADSVNDGATVNAPAAATGFQYCASKESTAAITAPSFTVSADNNAFTVYEARQTITSTFKDENGDDLGTTTALYGADVTAYEYTPDTGWKLDGWSLEQNGDVLASLGTADTTGKTYYAVVSQIPYKVSYKINGGTWTGGGTDDTAFYTAFYGEVVPCGSTESTVYAEEDQFGVKRTGYNFLGWSTNENATAADANKTVGSSDIVLYAVWAKKNYNVTFKLQGGKYDGKTDDIVKLLAYESEITAPTAEEVTLDGFTLLGWSKTANGEKVDSLGTVPADNNTVFYALWAANTNTAYNVEVYTMKADGAYAETPDKAAETYNDGTTNATVDGKTKVTPPAGFKFDPDKASLATVTVTADGKATAKVYLARESYTYEFKMNGKVVDSGSALYGASFSTTKVPTAAELTAYNKFAGWNTTPGTDDTWTYADNAYVMGAGNAVVTGNEALKEYGITVTYKDADTGEEVAPILSALTGATHADDISLWDIYDEIDEACDYTYPVGYYLDGVSYQVGDETITVYSYNDEMDEPVNLTDDTCFKAVYSPAEYSVLFYSASDIPTSEYYDEAWVDYEDLAQVVLYGEEVADIADEDLPTKQGYKFAGWNYEATDAAVTLPADLTSDSFSGINNNDSLIVLYATWTPATDTAYNVEVYTMGTDGTYAETTSDVRPGTGTTEATIDARTLLGELDPGYVLDTDKSTDAVSKGVIAPDGSTTVKVYVKRTQNTVTFYAADNTTPVQSNTLYYGADISAPENTPKKDGYEFEGWSKTPNATITGNVAKTMGTVDLDYYPVYSAKSDTAYTIEVYQMGADGAYPAAASATQTPTGITGTVVDARTAVTFEPVDYAIDTTKSTDAVSKATLAATGTTVKVYLERTKKTVTFVDENNATVGTKDLIWGAPINADTASGITAPTKTGNTFAGWNYNGQTAVPKTGLTVTPTYTPNSYNVTFNLSGGNVGGSTDDVVSPLTYGTDITAPASVEKSGYTLLGWSTNSTATAPDASLGSVPANDNTVLYAVWAAATGVEYKVETYTMKTDGNYADTADAPAATYADGVTDAQVNGQAKVTVPAGFKFDPDKASLATVTVTADGKATAKVYLARETYTYKFTMNGNTVDEGSALYGATFTTTKVPTAAQLTAHYDFAAWNTTPGTDDTWTYADNAYVMGAGNAVVTGTETPHQYTATFSLNGGNVNGSTKNPTANFIYNADVTAPAVTPTKAGYEFKGWSADAAATAGTKDLKMPGSDTTFYAAWAPAAHNVKVYVVYQAVDGSYPEITTASPVACGTVNTNAAATVQTTATANTTAITCNDTDVASFRNDRYNVNTEKSTLTATAGENANDVELVVYLARNIFTVTTIDNGVSDNGKEYRFQQSADLTPAGKKGYTFEGWDTNPNAETAAIAPDDDYKVTSNVTLYAIYSINSYDVTFNLMGGNVDGKTNDVVETLEYNSAITAPAAQYSGYTLLGWSTTPNGEKVASLGNVPDNNNTTFYAIWSASVSTYKVLTKVQKADGNYDETLSDAIDYTTDATVTITPDAPAEGFKAATGTFSGKVTADNALVLTVVYDRESYKAKFDVDGAVSESADTLYGAEYDLPAALSSDPAKDGYKFEGWSTDSKATTGIASEDIPAMPAGGVTYYAIWSANPHTITYYVNDEISGEVEQTAYNETVTQRDAISEDGYDFSGWKWYNAAGQEISKPAAMLDEDLTVKGTLTAKTITLTFDPAGGVATYNNTDYTEKFDVVGTYGENVPAVTVAREGYELSGFNGWDHAIPETFPAESDSFTAVWGSGASPYKINVYIMGLDGAYDETKPITTSVTGITATTVTLTPGTVTGFSFDADKTDGQNSATIKADGTTVLKLYYSRDTINVTWNVNGTPVEETYFYGAVINAPEVNVEGKTLAGWSDTADGEAVTVPETAGTDNLVFYALLADGSYKVTYKVDGEAYGEAETYAYGADVTELAEPTKTGYTFSGWTWSTADGKAPATMPAEDLTVTGTFALNSYKVTYFDAKGEVFATYEAVPYGSEIPVPESKPEKQYYEFVEWNYGEYSTMPADNISVYPVMQKNPIRLIPRAGSTTIIDYDNYVIYGLEDKLTLTKLTDVFLDVEGYGELVITPVADGWYGTGTLVQIRDLETGEIVEGQDYYVVLFGDANGDGRITTVDVNAMKQENAFLTNYSRTGAQYNPYIALAMDCDHDGRIFTDYSAAQNHVAYLDVIDQCPADLDLSIYSF